MDRTMAIGPLEIQRHRSDWSRGRSPKLAGGADAIGGETGISGPFAQAPARTAVTSGVAGARIGIGR